MGIKVENSKCPCLIGCLVSRVWCWSSIPTNWCNRLITHSQHINLLLWLINSRSTWGIQLKCYQDARPAAQTALQLWKFLKCTNMKNIHTSALYVSVHGGWNLVPLSKKHTSSPQGRLSTCFRFPSQHDLWDSNNSSMLSFDSCEGNMKSAIW
jgi:hypothetical protein